MLGGQAVTAELWLEKRCVHGFIGCGELICDHQPGEHPRDEHGTILACMCDGGSRVRLDPDKVVFPGFTVGSEYVGSTAPSLTVQDVIDALEEAANG